MTIYDRQRGKVYDRGNWHDAGFLIKLDGRYWNRQRKCWDSHIDWRRQSYKRMGNALVVLEGMGDILYQASIIRTDCELAGY